MILIDDLEKWSPSELRQRCDGLDQCSRAGSPIGVIDTGAPAGDLQLARADRAGVFEVRQLGVLSQSEARAVLLETAGQRGITIEQGAYDLVAGLLAGTPATPATGRS